jgi:hypothetical protein
MNRYLLGAKMGEKNISNAQLAKALSIDEATLYRKKSGTSDFYRREIQIIKNVLNLSDEDIRLIFFTDVVA